MESVAVVMKSKDTEYNKLRKLVLNQASSPKKKKSSKKDEKKLKKDGKKSKKEIRKSKQKERRVAYRTLTLWSQRQIAMLKETIACHRWKAAAKILNALTYETDRTSEIIAMAGFQIFCNHSESNHELLNQFSNSMSRMDKVFHPASILKNVMVLLINDDFKTAKQIIEDESIIKKIAQINVPLNEKQKKVFSILKGYKALFKYIDWVSSGGRLGDEDNELFSQERQTRLQAQERLGLANNAIDMFEGLFQEPGNWDIFIPKYIELIEFCGMKEKAIVTLHNYCKLNPMNPNSYIFFYDFLCKHFKNQKLLLLSSLKKLKLVKPCDKRIFDLQKLLKSTDNCLELESYFNMIDHPQWRNDATAWKTFANRILHFCKKPDKSEVSKLAKKLGELWRDRSDWWPDFHFVKSEVKIKSEEHADLFLYKALVLTSLTTTDNEYINKVRKKLSRHFKHHLKKLDEYLIFFNKLDNPDIDYSENNSDTSIEEAPNDENERIPGDNDAFMNENEEENTIPSSEAVAQQQNDVQPIRIDELDEYERLSGCEVTLFTSNVDENVNPLELVEVCETEPKPRVNNLTQTLNPALDVSFALSEDYNANSNIQSAVNDCLERLGSPRSENAELKRNEGMEENQMNTNEEEEVVNDEDDWLERYDAACPIPRSGTVRKRSAESEVREIEANYDELLNSGLGLSRLWFTPSDCVVNGGQETENEVVGKVKRKKEKKQRNEEVIIAQINCDDSLEKQRKKKKKKRRCEDEIETENPVDVKKHKKHKKSRRGIEDEEVTCEKNETTNGMEENEKVKCKKRKNEDINGGDESTRKRKKRRSEIDENELNESSVTIVEEDTEQSVKVKRRKKTKKRQEETQINGDDDSINRDTKRRSREYDETLSSQDFRKSKKLTLNDSELKQEDTTEDDDGFLKSICSWQNKYGVDQIKQEVNDEQDDEIIDTQMELF